MSNQKYLGVGLLALLVSMLSQLGGFQAAGASVNSVDVAQQAPSRPSGSSPPRPSVVQNPEALPVCVAGPNVASGQAPANPGYCRAPAGRPGRPFDNAYPGDATQSAGEEELAAGEPTGIGNDSISVTAAQAPGPYYWGGPLGTFSNYGVYAAIEVTDPDVPVCPYPCPPSNEAHYASRVMSRAFTPTPQMEIGWAEAGYETLVAGARPQEIFVEFVNSSGYRAHDWLIGYPISPGDWIYVATVGGGGIWQAQLWWNNQWNVLRSESIGLPTPAPRVEAFGEALTTLGNLYNASGSLYDVQVSTAPGVWVPWDTSRQPTVKVSCPPYAVNYAADYYWFVFFKGTAPPQQPVRRNALGLPDVPVLEC